jgi:hypothetical protein
LLVVEVVAAAAVDVAWSALVVLVALVAGGVSGTMAEQMGQCWE